MADHAYSDRMPAAVLWLIFALVLAGAEALTGRYVLGDARRGCAGRFGDQLADGLAGWVNGAVFLIVSVLLLVLVRPALRRQLTPAHVPQMGIEALDGKNALVLDRGSLATRAR